MENKNIITITQVTLSQEQREKANQIDNFSKKINEKLDELFDVIKNQKFKNYQGQKISIYNSNKSISINYFTKKKYKDAGISISDAVRYILDNGYLND